LTNFSLLFAADVVGLGRKSAAKSNEKLVYQNYATLFLSWIPFTAAAFLYDECRIGEGEIKIDFGKIYWDLQA
jgi:hypothetical protein